jgi:hypothetical protein
MKQADRAHHRLLRDANEDFRHIGPHLQIRVTVVINASRPFSPFTARENRSGFRIRAAVLPARPQHCPAAFVNVIQRHAERQQCMSDTNRWPSMIA